MHEVTNRARNDESATRLFLSILEGLPKGHALRGELLLVGDMGACIQHGRDDLDRTELRKRALHIFSKYRSTQQ